MKPGKISSYSDLELALMVLLGVYGNGAARRQALGSRYTAAQGIVQFILHTDNIPDGSGPDPEKIRQAVQKVFEKSVNEISNEVIENL